MNLQPTATQAAIAETSRRLLSDLFPLNRRVPLDPSADGDTVVRWQMLGEAGFFGLRLPEATGGAGLGLPEQALVCREIGRQAAPLDIMACMLAAEATDMPASVAVRLRSGVARAGVVFPASLPLCRSAATPIEASAYASGGAEHFLVVRPGASMVVTEEHLLLRWGASLAQDLQIGVGSFDESLLKRAHEVEDDAFWRGAVMIAATLVGLAETALELTVTHARSRIQFGAPIGVNQAVRHPCADVATQIEVARAQMLHAALAVEARASEAPYLTACARVLASDVARMSTRTCIQVHGGLGVTDEFPAHRLLKQVAVADRWFGATEFHLGLLAPTTTRSELSQQDRERPNKLGRGI